MRIFAVTLLISCLVLPPAVWAGSFDGAYQRAERLTEAGKHAEAAQVYSAILARDPNQYAALAARADAYFNAKEWQKTIDDETKVVAHDPKFQHGYILLGISADFLGHYRQAVRYFDKAIPFGGLETGTAYRSKALALMGMGDITGARAAIKMAIQKDAVIPEYAPLNEKVRRQIEEAAIHLPEVGGVVDDRLARAQRLEASGKDAQSLEVLESILKKNPEDAGALALRGSIYADALEYDKAIPELKHALALSPTYGRGWLSLCKCYLQLSRWNEAMAAADRAIALNGADAGAGHRLKGNVYIKLNKPLEALREFDKAIVAHRSRGVVRDDYYDRARADRMLNDYAACVRDLTTILKSEPRNGINLTERGDAYVGLKNYDAALADYGAAYSLNKENRAAVAGMAKIYELKGDRANAASMKRTLKELDNSSY